MVYVARVHPRVLSVPAASLGLVLVAALLLPHGSERAGAAEPAPSAGSEGASLAHATAGLSAVTSAAAAEIDRVVDLSLVSARRIDARSDPSALAAAQIRCALFEGQRYCLHTGWTESSQTRVVRDAARTVERQARPQYAARRTQTGDASLLALLRRDARRSPEVQAEADRAELTQAAQSVGKVWLLRHQIQGEPLPAGFLADHPEVTLRAPARLSATLIPNPLVTPPTPSATPTPTAPTSPASPTAVATTVAPVPAPSVDPESKPGSAYPQRRSVLDPAAVADQTRTYWCGPTAMQMIAWGWSKVDQGQDLWASRLGTTRHGTSIAAMVAVTNRYTGWGGAAYAGPYIALDVQSFTYHQWWKLIMRHVVDYRSPVILHPVLLKQWYPYLDDDASGHFQVGRGYDKRGARANRISYFEPWNQQRFDPSEPYIERVQSRNAYKSYRANLAHFQHNIGV